MSPTSQGAIVNDESPYSSEEIIELGLELGWAKLWVTHDERPELDQKATAPCPYCGKPLRTPAAKQCRFRGRDWHDQQ